MASIKMLALISILTASTLAARVPTSRLPGRGFTQVLGEDSGTPTITSLSPLATTATARRGPSTTRSRSSNDDNQCPNDWSDNIYNAERYCCPGQVYSNGNDPTVLDDAYCCVGATLTQDSCFPFCTTTTTAASQPSCTSSVPLTASDYSSRVSEAAKGVATITGTVAGSGSNSGSGSGSNGGGSTGSSSAGAAMITSGPLAGAMMVAGGLLLAM